MNLGLFKAISYTITRFSLRNLLGTYPSFYSTTSTTTKTQTKPNTIFRKPWRGSLNELYRRISPVGDPKTSIVPILDQWIEEGRSVNKDQLLVFIKELRYYKRYTHALEISMWMTDKRYFALTSRDVAIRLDLMSKVCGIEQVENYFNNIPKQLKGLNVYGALLNCYSYVKSVDKAEAVMQRMRDLGFAVDSLAYNVMLSLYYRTGNTEKLNTLAQEMDRNGIHYDKFTYTTLLSMYAAVSDIEGLEKIIRRMESDPNVVLDWATFATVANGYTKAGLPDKASEMLKKCEGLITSRRRSTAYDFLITQYAAIGKKDEALRIWELYKKKEKVYNKGYISIISSLLKFNDWKNVEKIFEEWEAQNLSYDIRILNFLIGAYSRKGFLEKAETLMNGAITKGVNPNAWTWYYLATGYLQNDQTPKAVEAMKKSIVLLKSRWKPSNESLVGCLRYLKQEGDLEKAEEFIKLLGDNDIISSDVQDELLDHIKDGNLVSVAISALNDNYLARKSD